jgi:hypothetical protein
VEQEGNYYQEMLNADLALAKLEEMTGLVLIPKGVQP